MSQEHQFDRLQRQVRECRIVSILTLVCFGLTIAAVVAYRRSSSSITVRARRFVLVDDEGRELGEWWGTGSAPRLDMRARRGGSGLHLHVDEDSSQATGLTVFSHGNRASLETIANSSGNGGHASLYAGKIRDHASVVAGDGLAPALRLTQDGEARVRAVAHWNRSSVAVILGGKTKAMELPGADGE